MATGEKLVGAGVAVRPVPEGYHSVTPYLTVRGVARLSEFVKLAFDATEKGRFSGPDGSIMHAEVRIGDSMVMMGEPHGDVKPMPGMLHLYVSDVDETYRRAIAAGAKSLREPADQFYGDRSSGVEDMCGNQWWISTHVEDVSEEEMRRRMDSAGH